MAGCEYPTFAIAGIVVRQMQSNFQPVATVGMTGWKRFGRQRLLRSTTAVETTIARVAIKAITANGVANAVEAFTVDATGTRRCFAE